MNAEELFKAQADMAEWDAWFNDDYNDDDSNCDSNNDNKTYRPKKNLSRKKSLSGIKKCRHSKVKGLIKNVKACDYGDE